MWISRKKWNQLEKRITELEKNNQSLNQKTQGLEESFLLKICTNSVMKEQYNFELLKHLFEKLNLKIDVYKRQEENGFLSYELPECFR